MLSPGDHFDRYVIERVLGQGGMGVVYRALDARLGRRVALKVLGGGEGSATPPSTDGPARLLREARAAAALDHPNAVAIYDVGEFQGTPYLAMELVPGKTLRAYVGDAKVPLAERLAWLADVARALAAAHRAGLVHRDVKPENVMVRDDGAVKVLDFGIARQASGAIDPLGQTGMALAAITAEGVAVGTPLYMAPEQITGAPVDGRSDQFAWGVLAYELLSGASPWTGARDMLTLAGAILRTEPAPLADVAPEVPRPIVDVVMRALRKAPAERSPSMDAVVEAFDALARGATELQPSVQLPPAPSRGAARTVALLAGLLVVLAGVGVLLGTRAPAPRHVEAVTPAVSSASAGEPASTAPVAKPEAVAAYRDALSAFRDGQWHAWITFLRKAASADAAFAPASLRLALGSLFDDAVDLHEARKAIAVAALHRDVLAGGDRALFEAAQRMLAVDPPDTEAFVGALGPVADGAPGDAELGVLYAKALQASGHPDDATRVLDRVRTADPEDATALLVQADVAWSKADTGERRRVLDDCVARFPRATTCLLHRSYETARSCADDEADAQRVLAIDPSDPGAYDALLDGAIALGRGEAAAAVALDEVVAHARESTRDASRAAVGASIAYVYGHFDDANARLRAFADAHPTNRGQAPEIDRLRLVVAEEVGDRAAGAAIVREILSREALWARVEQTEHGQLLADALRTGAMDRATFARELAAYQQGLPALFAQLPNHREGPDRARYEPWIDGWARAVVTADDAAEALRRFADEKVVAVPRTAREGTAHARVLLLAGRAADALPLLRRSAASCHPMRDVGAWAAAGALLGQALEATGDRAGACEAYAGVLGRWGRAGRSVTADDVRARSRKLGCAPAR